MKNVRKVSSFELCKKEVYKSCTESVQIWTLKKKGVWKCTESVQILHLEKKRCMEVVWKVFKFELRKLMMFGSGYKVSLIKKVYGSCMESVRFS